jgi:hypothetical protein
MKISKHYEENILVGPYQSIKVGLTIHSDKELGNFEEIKKYNQILLELVKKLVKQDLDSIREERKQFQKQEEE